MHESSSRTCMVLPTGAAAASPRRHIKRGSIFVHACLLHVQMTYVISPPCHLFRHKAAVESYLEELVVRRELADNFCHYTPDYDNLSCAAEWARESLEKHRTDKREFLYTRWVKGLEAHARILSACHSMLHRLA